MTVRAFRYSASFALIGLVLSVEASAQDAAPPSTGAQAVTAESTDLRALQREFRRLLDGSRWADALPIARRLVELSEGYSLAQRIGAHFDLASLMRQLDDLDGAVLEYNVVISLAGESSDPGAYLGIVYDNVAMIRRAQEQWAAAEAASDRALEIFEKTVGTRDIHYGAALNNRAIILSEQGKTVLALDYSERALAVLRESFAKDPKALEPFLEDNRRIRAALPR
ncbi:MAG TPA: tetratricopeptide repeat protein [Vicinamibacterales bacterium]|jgi:tetratricopeptide (TPR) repeat protein